MCLRLQTISTTWATSIEMIKTMNISACIASCPCKFAPINLLLINFPSLDAVCASPHAAAASESPLATGQGGI
jgi:hypothetical protein